ncbi:MAG: mechanosensitive ion channel [Gammaproteobacteria bacterium]|nr:mechanosensitive ion channel [Gammaproteobacteria bacterium]
MDFLKNLVLDHQAVILDYSIRIIVSLFIIWLGIKLSKLISKWIGNLLLKRSIDSAISAFVQSLTRILLLIAVVIAGLSNLGIETTTFVTIIGAAGLAIALALQGSLSNFASGLLIAGFRPFKAGDYVEAAGVAGVVKEIQIFSTIMTTPDNKQVVVPNAQVTGSAITNYSTNPTRRIDLVIGVAYDSDLKACEQIFHRILDNHPLILKDPKFTIGVLELADSSINFAVRSWVKTEDFWTVKFDLNQSIKQALDDAGIGIPFPQMDVHLHSQNQA